MTVCMGPPERRPRLKGIVSFCRTFSVARWRMLKGQTSQIQRKLGKAREIASRPSWLSLSQSSRVGCPSPRISTSTCRFLPRAHGYRKRGIGTRNISGTACRFIGCWQRKERAGWGAGHHWFHSQEQLGAAQSPCVRRQRHETTQTRFLLGFPMTMRLDPR